MLVGDQQLELLSQTPLQREGISELRMAGPIALVRTYARSGDDVPTIWSGFECFAPDGTALGSIGSADLLSYLHDVRVLGSMAVHVDEGHSELLNIFDFSNPDPLSPVRSERYNYPVHGVNVPYAISSSLLLAPHAAGLWLLGPEQCFPLPTCPNLALPSDPASVAELGDRWVAIGVDSNGMWAVGFDVADPFNTRVGSVARIEGAHLYGYGITDDIVWLHNTNSAPSNFRVVDAIDLSDFENPVHLGTTLASISADQSISKSGPGVLVDVNGCVVLLPKRAGGGVSLEGGIVAFGSIERVDELLLNWSVSSHQDWRHFTLRWFDANGRRVGEEGGPSPLVGVQEYQHRLARAQLGGAVRVELTAESSDATFRASESVVPIEGLWVSHPAPSPFSGVATVQFVASGSSPVTAQIVDVRGRVVRTWASFDVAATQLVWDGRDDRGDVVASGRYFLLLRQGSRAVTRSMELLR